MAAPIHMQSAPGPETVIDGERFLYFGGTSYLGLAAHPDVIAAGCDALRRYGVHSATSRSGCGTLPPVAEVEALAARFFGTEAAFYFGSGFCSNHVLVAACGADVDAVLLADSAHYSVHEAARLSERPIIPFQAGNAFDLARRVGAHRRVLLMTDAVSPVSGEVPPVKEYLDALKPCERVTVLLDDAHGFGVLGSRGRGLLDELGLWRRANGGLVSEGVEWVVGGTLSKALGGFGGVIPGSHAFIERLKKASHYFEGASAPAAALAGSSAKALEMVLQEPQWRRRLRDNCRQIRSAMPHLGIEVPDLLTAHFGFTLGSVRQNQAVHDALKKQSIYLPYLRSYSGLGSDGALRLAVFATHTEEQLDRLVNALKDLV